MDAAWGAVWVISPVIPEAERVGLQMPVRWAFAYARNVAPRRRISAPRHVVLFNVRNAVQLWSENNKFKGGYTMKIAVPVNNKSLESTVASSFGRTPYFLIYDTEAQTSAFFDNSAAASQGGAGIKAAQTVVDSGAVAVLVPQCGDNAATVLKDANLKMYKTISVSIMDNIIAFNAGKLPLLDATHAGFHNHGGK